jgi:alkaline phosphatase
LLSQNHRGFFLMVEASQVDWADHAMDPIHSVTDFVAFDKAVKAAVDFAERDGNTLILVFPDHNTGGLTIGNRSTDSTYKAMSLEMVLHPLAGMKITSTGLGRNIGESRDIRFIASQILQWWGIETTEQDNREIPALMDKGLSVSDAISEVISKNHTVFGWTTHGHTGDDVPMWSFGPNRPVGLFDNTDLAKMIACSFGFSREETSDRLFVDAGKSFSPGDITVDAADPNNPVLVIHGARLPVGKDLLMVDGKTYQMEGIVVQAPVIDKHFIPIQAVTLIKQSRGEDIH